MTKPPPLYRIVITFPDKTQKVTAVFGKPEAKLRYKSALQTVAKLGGWVSVFDEGGTAVSFSNR